MPTESSVLDALTGTQQDVLKALVAGQSISAAAKGAGIDRSTVHLWTQKNPGFDRALLAARRWVPYLDTAAGSEQRRFVSSPRTDRPSQSGHYCRLRSPRPPRRPYGSQSA